LLKKGGGRFSITARTLLRRIEENYPRNMDLAYLLAVAAEHKVT